MKLSGQKEAEEWRKEEKAEKSGGLNLEHPSSSELEAEFQPIVDDKTWRVVMIEIET